mmetsp:Transcript_46568/g.108235  ORF Transcript_46568/g.108235 Transcript_46568/m.108235 type:complete len:449 (+) Transcript_46568:568-1914(+)
MTQRGRPTCDSRCGPTSQSALEASSSATLCATIYPVHGSSGRSSRRSRRKRRTRERCTRRRCRRWTSATSPRSSLSPSRSSKSERRRRSARVSSTSTLWIICPAPRHSSSIRSTCSSRSSMATAPASRAWSPRRSGSSTRRRSRATRTLTTRGSTTFGSRRARPRQRGPSTRFETSLSVRLRTCRRRQTNGSGGGTSICGSSMRSSRSLPPSSRRTRDRSSLSAGALCRTPTSLSASSGCTTRTSRCGKGGWKARASCLALRLAGVQRISCSRPTSSSNYSWARCRAAVSSTTNTCSGTPLIALRGPLLPSWRRRSASWIAAAPYTSSPSASPVSTCRRCCGSRTSTSRCLRASGSARARYTAICSSAPNTSRCGCRLPLSSATRGRWRRRRSPRSAERRSESAEKRLRRRCWPKRCAPRSKCMRKPSATSRIMARRRSACWFLKRGV